MEKHINKTNSNSSLIDQIATQGRLWFVIVLTTLVLACGSSEPPAINGPTGTLTNGPVADEPTDDPTNVPTMVPVDRPQTGAVGVPATASLNVPALTDNSFLIGAEILGEMVRYHPKSGAASTYSDLRQLDSYADYAGSVDVAKNTITAVSDDNALNVLDLQSGNFLWDIALGVYQDTSIYTPTAPVCAVDICYAMGSGGDVVAVDMNKKTTLWTVDLFPGEDNQINVIPLLVTKERIFAGGYRYSSVYGDVEPKLSVLSRDTGRVIQDLPAGFPTMAGDLLLTSGGHLRAYDFATLQLVWTANVEFASTPAVVGDVVVIHTADSNVAENVGQRVMGINRIDGAILWTREAGTMQTFFSPNTDGQLIYTNFAETCSLRGCSSGYPMALNPADGSVVWTNQEVDNKGAQPVVVAGQLLYDDVSAYREVGGSHNYERGAASLDSTTGAIQWISLGGYSFYSMTAIINGKAIRSNREPTFVADR